MGGNKSYYKFQNMSIKNWVKKQFNYRIYLRLSREILDKIWPIFFQFHLYVGHVDQNMCNALFKHIRQKNSVRKIFNFGQILYQKCSLRLIRRLTYTRIYTVDILNKDSYGFQM